MNPLWYLSQMGRSLDHPLKVHKRTLTSGNAAQSVVLEHAIDQMHEIEINWKWDDYYHPYSHQRCAHWKLANLYRALDNESH